ncbi:MAG: DUF2268 domain-containing putative Zn-dependent protease, partial [Acidimicrobiales bacterium]
MTVTVKGDLARLRQWSVALVEQTPARFGEMVGLSAERLDDLVANGGVRPQTDRGVLAELIDAFEDLRVADIARQTLAQLVAEYPNDANLVVQVWPMDPSDEFGRQELRGVAANTDYDGFMTLVVSPHSEVQAILEETVTHEYHHYLRASLLHLTAEDETLHERLVLEGLAEDFVVHVRGVSTAPWLAETLISELEVLRPRYRDHLARSGTEIVPWLFGDEALGLPPWAG